jgi:NAD(P)-dependent dehydrogenase (short-subunit alcohol dehydrogenase family)
MTDTTRLLESKTAIVYGAGGSLGGGVARTFAREGAAVHLGGRTREPLDAVAADIAEAGGTAEVAVLDAVDEEAVAAHADAVAASAGSIDISFNLITRGDVQGQPLLEMSVDDLARPVETGLRSNFVTARAAARHMVAAGGGVILHLNSGSSGGQAPMMGGTGPADAATEALMRNLAMELGPQGVRVLGIWTAGVADTLTKEKLAAVGGAAAPDPAVVAQMIGEASMLKRAPRIQQVADVAAFLASDRSSGMTAAIANVTCGLVG